MPLRPRHDRPVSAQFRPATGRRSPEEAQISPDEAALAEIEQRIQSARQEGFNAGRSVGRQDALSELDTARETRLTEEREAIRTQLAALLDQDSAQRRSCERDITELFLGIAERLVPELLETYGPASRCSAFARASPRPGPIRA